MKRIIALFLTTVMMLTLLTACGNSDTNPSGDGATSTGGEETGDSGNSEASTGGQDGDIYEIYIAWMNFGSGVPTGMESVENAINEIVGPELGVNIKLLPMSAGSLVSEQNLMISTGDKIDLVITMDLGGMVNSNALLPLEDLYAQYGGNIKNVAQKSVDSAGYYNGTLYSIPLNYVTGQDYGFEGRKDIFEKYGFAPEEGKRYTFDELEAMFEVIKAGEGDSFYMLSNVNATEDLSVHHFPYHAIGGSSSGASAGALIFDFAEKDWSKFTTIVNLYESDEYREFAERVYRWAQKGFISPDGGSNTDASETLMMSGNYLGQLYYITGDAVANFSSNTGYEIVAFPTEQQPFSLGVTALGWGIPVTCENPEKTFQFLDYLYGDNNVDGMLQFGLEGQDYVVLDTNEYGDILIDYPEGLDAATVPYFQVAGIFGDRLSWPIFYPNDINMNQELREFEASIVYNSPGIGYSFDSSAYTTEISAINAVLNEYKTIISSGAVDPDIELPLFIDALKAAGIDTVIAANQEQFDAWLASRQ